MKVRQLSAAEQAISANCSAVGVGITAQSEKINRPRVPPRRGLLVSITKQEEAVLTLGRVPMMVRPARRTRAVVFSAPATMASA